ncbi:MAG: TetR family transcriptional regulator [Alcanivoracaceae bacterium]|nr:TetR family transcriptional regulator [Alcanivoracaceae bacterium]
MSSVRAQRKAETRQRILDAALALLASGRGMDSLGLREVAREVGLAPPSLYNHFPTMDDLGLALIDLACYRLRSVMRQGRKQMVVRDPSAGVQDLVHRFLAYLAEYEGEFRLLVQQRLGNTERFRRRIQRELQLFREELEEDARAVAESRGMTDMHYRAASEAAVAVIFGFGIIALEMSPAVRQAAIPRAVMELKMVFLGGRALAAGAELGDELVPKTIKLK